MQVKRKKHHQIHFRTAPPTIPHSALPHRTELCASLLTGREAFAHSNHCSSGTLSHTFPTTKKQMEKCRDRAKGTQGEHGKRRTPGGPGRQKPRKLRRGRNTGGGRTRNQRRGDPGPGELTRPRPPHRSLNRPTGSTARPGSNP